MPGTGGNVRRIVNLNEQTVANRERFFYFPVENVTKHFTIITECLWGHIMANRY